MSQFRRRFASTWVLLCVCGSAYALPMSANFAITAEDAGGNSVDVDLSIAPTEHLTLSAGAGHSRGSDESAGLTGTLLNAALSLHGERAGFALNYDHFGDSSNYRSGTLGARAWVTAGDFEFALLGRQRNLDVTLTLQLPLRTVRREVGFSALGGGLQIGFTRGNFSAYAMALSYEYDDAFDEFMDLQNSPLLSRRPRIEALAGSFFTQAQGAIDRQGGFGLEYSFGRNALGLDLSSVHDAVLDADSLSVALTFRHAQSAHIDWSLSAGMVDSDTYGSVGFLGVGLGLAN